MRGGAVVRLFVLAKDDSGLRELAVTREGQNQAAEAKRAFFEGIGYESIVVVGFDLQDVMQSHPAWFRIKGDS
jgi:hypothetical protein